VRVGVRGGAVLIVVGFWVGAAFGATGPAAPSAPATSAPTADASEADLPAPTPIAWRTNPDEARKEAAKTGHLVLLAFVADWCQPCEVMDRGTFGSKAVALTLERHFIPVRIDDSKVASPTSQTYHVRVYPTVIFLSATGDVLHTVEGPQPPKAFLSVMEQVAALPALFEAQKKNPDDLAANFALGNALALLNQVTRGAPYLERAAQLDTDNQHGRRSQARLILALVPLEAGDSAEALRLLKQFEVDFKGDPQVPTAVFFQGAVLFQDGKLEEARAVFVRMQKEFPKHPKTYEADKAILAIDARLEYQKRLEEAGLLPKGSSLDGPPSSTPAAPESSTPAAPAETPRPKPKD